MDPGCSKRVALLKSERQWTAPSFCKQGYSRLIRILVDPQTFCSQRQPYVCRWHEPIFDNFCWWSEVLKGLACFRFGKWSPGLASWTTGHIYIYLYLELQFSVFVFSWLIAIKLDSRKTRIGILTEVYLHVFWCLVSLPGVIRSGFSLQDATRGKMQSLVHYVHLKNIPPQKA